MLFLGSAALQLIASLQRWVIVSAEWTRTDRLIEDHRFDYSYPADPWENVGTAAQLFGLGVILLAFGVVALARACRRLPDRGTTVVTVVVALAFGITGLHAVVSGLAGIPSPAQYLSVQLILSIVQIIGLLFLGLRWLTVSWGAAIACVFLLGSTLPGYLAATFLIAPAIAGYQSYDTTPWTETIVAATTALAGLWLLVAVGIAKLRSASIRTSTVPDLA
ncbi:hypothetical protein JF66_18420 [Cryobacterium sp. MLB-32]|nr:hypothetical protein JF66_18420 [Cryobacterium sp. MLB-32]